MVRPGAHRARSPRLTRRALLQNRTHRCQIYAIPLHDLFIRNAQAIGEAQNLINTWNRAALNPRQGRVADYATKVLQVMRKVPAHTLDLRRPESQLDTPLTDSFPRNQSFSLPPEGNECELHVNSSAQDVLAATVDSPACQRNPGESRKIVPVPPKRFQNETQRRQPQSNAVAKSAVRQFAEGRRGAKVHAGKRLVRAGHGVLSGGSFERQQGAAKETSP